MDLRQTTAQAFAILTGIELKTNGKILRQKAKQNKRAATTTTKMDNGSLTLYISDGFQCDLSKLLTV